MGRSKGIRKQDSYDGYVALANAIVAQACVDYLKAKRLLKDELQREEKRCGVIKSLQALLNDSTRFFKSRFYRDLTDTDGDWLLEQLESGYVTLDKSDNLHLIKNFKKS